MAQVERAPSAMDLNCCVNEMRSGRACSSVSANPTPSWPWLLLPQQYAAPDTAIPQVCVHPAEIEAPEVQATETHATEPGGGDSGTASAEKPASNGTNGAGEAADPQTSSSTDA